MQGLKDILSEERSICRAPGVSKKRVFETIANIICENQPNLSYTAVLEKLIAREELGSTALGDGIAIPHCRVSNCEAPLGTILTLEQAIEFDAPDDKPVDLLFVLLVPEEAHQAHLDILAEVARLFNQPEYCRTLREAQDNSSLFSAATSNWD
jgi:nitrogen PTS system EIIA component